MKFYEHSASLDSSILLIQTLYGVYLFLIWMKKIKILLFIAIIK